MAEETYLGHPPKRERKETSVLRAALREAGHSQRAFPSNVLTVLGVKSSCDSPALEICEIALTPYIELHFLLKLCGVGFCFM